MIYLCNKFWLKKAANFPSGTKSYLFKHWIVVRVSTTVLSHKASYSVAVKSIVAVRIAA